MAQESHSPRFVQTSTAGLAVAATRPVFGQAPAVQPAVDQAGRGRVGQRQPLQERRAGHGRAEGLRDDHEGRRRARRGHRRRQPVRARSRRHQRRLRRPAQCRRRRAARLVLHARPDQARRRRGVHRRRAHAVARRQGRARARPIITCIVGKDAQAVRPQHGVQGRGRPQHRALAAAVARVEAAHRPGALPRSEEARRRGDGGRPQHGARRPHRSRPLLRHHQHGRRQRRTAKSAA